MKKNDAHYSLDHRCKCLKNTPYFWLLPWATILALKKKSAQLHVQHELNRENPFAVDDMCTFVWFVDKLPGTVRSDCIDLRLHHINSIMSFRKRHGFFEGSRLLHSYNHHCGTFSISSSHGHLKNLSSLYQRPIFTDAYINDNCVAITFAQAKITMTYFALYFRCIIGG